MHVCIREETLFQSDRDWPVLPTSVHVKRLALCCVDARIVIYPGMLKTSSIMFVFELVATISVLAATVQAYCTHSTAQHKVLVSCSENGTRFNQ